ncbi:DUF680 domain-containing protein [Mesorhizobium calcicola]|uniref:DUF680 domain-containing protein n=1 Tax=Mesorhizobium calcicola TaxID=1300310 RepID=A0ABW4WIT4_9HYPH
MNKMLIGAAAILALSGSALAASDNFGSNGANQPAVSVDSSYTASINKSEPAAQTPVTHGSDRNLFGNN